MSDATKSGAKSTNGQSNESEPRKKVFGAQHDSRVDVPSIERPEEETEQDASKVEQPPPLPPRPSRRVSNVAPTAFPSALTSARPRLQATATTAVSRTDIHTQSFQDGSREISAASKQLSPPTKSWGGWGSIRRLKIHDGDESASIRSYAPTLEAGGDVESLLGDVLGPEQTSGWNILSEQLEETGLQQPDGSDTDVILHDFDREFDEIDSLESSGENEGELRPGFPNPPCIPDWRDRGALKSMEVKAKAFLDTLISRQANLQSSWR